MAWVNHYLPPHICPITNFDSDLVDSRVYFHPLGMLWGKEEVLGENQKLTDPVERANLVVSMAKVISFDKFIDSRAILNGDSLVNSLFLSYLLDLRPYVGIYSVCFTQCLQNDFCGLGSPSNNVLHVGNQEAQRLHMEGGLSSFMNWANSQSPDDLALVHVRDWHDEHSTDLMEKHHLRKFGPHCIKNTKGAEFCVPGLYDNSRGMTFVIDSKTLSDYEGTAMTSVLEEIYRRAAGRPIMVGIIGVWTEAKVNYLFYDLSTREGGKLSHFGTCSALTASFSRDNHFSALKRLNSLLDVSIFDSVANFCGWLVPGSAVLYHDLISSLSSTTQILWKQWYQRRVREKQKGNFKRNFLLSILSLLDESTPASSYPTFCTHSTGPTFRQRRGRKFNWKD
eukprot:TRINITY_DN6050_c0_g1_i5.p1 TRINITY_DN6050_c0_g1~~TRINITY_DN6050_c0_g1_i5.p1  ORF type:complete len:395 (-),score=58.02 TRINITY_DN6050_c0_g1_i5:340-1524(-)